jgi:hypothetical protein
VALIESLLEAGQCEFSLNEVDGIMLKFTTTLRQYCVAEKQPLTPTIIWAEIDHTTILDLFV